MTEDQERGRDYIQEKLGSVIDLNMVTFLDTWINTGKGFALKISNLKFYSIGEFAHEASPYEVWREFPVLEHEDSFKSELLQKTARLPCGFQISPKSKIIIRPKMWESGLDSDAPCIVRNEYGYTVIKTNEIKLATPESSKVIDWVISETRGWKSF